MTSVSSTPTSVCTGFLPPLVVTGPDRDLLRVTAPLGARA